LQPINNIQLKTFSDLGISPAFLKALEELNIIDPTEIQVKAIPFLIEKGTDFIGQEPVKRLLLAYRYFRQ
jgi:superfamily II DNA/RNA helicase